ncbi:MAG: hypothetical protein FWH20_00140 [Oscillospiraceae bacterium]|nr:hypothetical protein [Oscillospiraceae bacterium]
MRIFAAAIILLYCICFAGCVPVEIPPQNEIQSGLDEVFTIGFTHTSTQEGERYTNYNYTAADGVDFAVNASILKGDYGDSLWGRCLYPERWLERNQSVIEGIIGSDYSSEFASTEVRIFIENYDDLMPVSEIIYSIISTISPLPINRKNGTYIDLSRLQVEVWADTHIRGFDFLYHDENPPTLDYIYTELEQQFLKYIEWGRIESDENLDENLFEKYTPSRLEKIKIGDEFFEDFIIVFHEEHDDFLVNFNPQLNFGAYPDSQANYSVEGGFKTIITALGGSHEMGDETAEWTIGSDTWTSVITTNDAGTIISFEVYKNGEKLDIKTPGIVGIIQPTLSDLELMTGARITVHRGGGYVEFN